MIRIAICDDSVNDASYLADLCNKCNMMYELNVHTFTDGELFIKEHQKNLYDIVFLDVEMPKSSGIEIGKQLRLINEHTIIIFSTNYPQYAIDGYDCEAFHYLLKPISPDKLEVSLHRAIKKIAFLHQYHCVKIQNTIRRIPIADIYFVEYCRKHVIYHTKEELIETTGRFSDVIKELQKFGFYQVHQGYIVNFSKVKYIRNYSIILEDNASVMISVRKKNDVLLTYAKYLEEIL